MDDAFEELFGDGSDDDVPETAAVKDAADGLKGKKDKKEKKRKKEKKEKSEKNERKDKKEKKEKKHKKDKKASKELDSGTIGDTDGAENAAKADAPASPGKTMLRIRKPRGAASTEAPQEGVASHTPADAQDAKQKKDKKDKKAKKEKKEKKDGRAGEVLPSAAAVADGAEAKGKEKKVKKDKKDKKEKKRKAAELEDDVHIPETEVPQEDDGNENAVFQEFFQELEDNALPPDTVTQTALDLQDALLGEAAEQAVVLEDQRALQTSEKPEPPRITPPSWLIEQTAEVKKQAKALRASGLTPQQIQLAKAQKNTHKTREELVAGTGSLAKRLDETLEALKLKKPLTITENNAKKFIENFVQEMIEAAEKDLRAFEEGRAEDMKHKVNMLGKCVNVMQKFSFAEHFVTWGGCRALALWLRPLPDGRLPSVHLRTALLNGMLRLPISKESLQNCKDPQLGQIVARLRANPEETVANKKTASTLIQRWLKQVLVVPAGASVEAGHSVSTEPPKPSLERKPAETLESFLKLEEESFKRMHPTIPVREGKDYQIHPPATAQALKRDKYAQDSNRFKLNEVLKDFNRPNKKSYRPYEVSVSGRQLNQL